MPATDVAGSDSRRGIASSFPYSLANTAASSQHPAPSSSTTSPFALVDDGVGSHPGPDAEARNRLQAQKNMAAGSAENDDYEGRPPYIHAMLAGGIGGTSGDMLMHSLDTVKTRQQGDPNFPPKYTSLGSSYYTIFRQEGIRRGLYGGWLPALLGSFPGTVLFFGTYEFSKRQLIDVGVRPQIAYLAGGFFGDLAASVIYVPSEVLKTRLQLQGRYQNPYFYSGYNYRGTVDAARTIVRDEGLSALFYGYKATLYRDLPFSALQFMFWEQALSWARHFKQSKDVGVPLEFLTGAGAGGLAGAITCPLDVVKTRLQTQVRPTTAAAAATDGASTTLKTSNSTPPDAPTKHTAETGLKKTHQPTQKRPISTSSPSTYTPRPGTTSLETSSVYTGLKVIYHTEGVAGWFRGVGPRVVWTSIQSGCMLLLYQTLLRKLEVWMPLGELPELKEP